MIIDYKTVVFSLKSLNNCLSNARALRLASDHSFEDRVRSTILQYNIVITVKRILLFRVLFNKCGNQYNFYAMLTFSPFKVSSSKASGSFTGRPAALLSLLAMNDTISVRFPNLVRIKVNCGRNMFSNVFNLVLYRPS